MAKGLRCNDAGIIELGMKEIPKELLAKAKAQFEKKRDKE